MDAEIVNSLVLGDIGFEKLLWYFELKTLFCIPLRDIFIYLVWWMKFPEILEKITIKRKNGMNSLPILIF